MHESETEIKGTGGPSMLGVLLKILVPALVIYFLVKKVFGVLTSIGILKPQDDGKTKPTDQVIDLCPKCGQVNSRGHRCYQETEV